LATTCCAVDAKEEKVLRHAVFFKFKDGTSADDLDKIVQAFNELPRKIDVIQDYQAGKNVSSVGLDDGFTHCFLLSFKDEAGRAEYLPHPEHDAFVGVLRPHLDKVFVIDYWGRPEKRRNDQQLKHAFFLKFKEDATDEQVRSVEEAIAKLPSQIDTIKSFEWGKNNSPEKHDDGFTHCFMLTFDSLDGLKEYAAQPMHQEVVELIKPVAEKARVLDFWTKESPDGDN
jgi:hypothetical protein